MVNTALPTWSLPEQRSEKTKTRAKTEAALVGSAQARLGSGRNGWSIEMLVKENAFVISMGALSSGKVEDLMSLRMAAAVAAAAAFGLGFCFL